MFVFLLNSSCLPIAARFLPEISQVIFLACSFITFQFIIIIIYYLTDNFLKMVKIYVLQSSKAEKIGGRSGEREKPLRIFICGEGDSQVRCVLTRRHFRAAKGTLVPSWTLRIFFHPYLQGKMPMSYQQSSSAAVVYGRSLVVRFFCSYFPKCLHHV